MEKKYLEKSKRRYANRHKLSKPDSDLIYMVENFNDDSFNGDISYYNFKNSDIKIVTPKGKIIVDNNYKLLGFYDYNYKVKLSAFYDKDNKIIEWYFDIAKEIGKENGVPYEDDLYLDVVVRPDGKTILLDEEELVEALNSNEITKEEYEMAYTEVNKLIDLLKNNLDKLKCFTDKYINYFNEMTNE